MVTKMKKYLLTIALILLTSTAWADTETIIPDGVVTPDDWANFGGANKVTSVTDTDDGTYIVEVTDEDNQMFTLSNTTFDVGVTVDSFRVISTCQDNGSGANKVQLVAFTDASNYCLGANQNCGTNPTTTIDSHLGAPNGANSCGGVLTKSVMDNLQIRVDATAIGNSREVRILKIEVIVFFTPAGGGEPDVSHRRRRLLQ